MVARVGALKLIIGSLVLESGILKLRATAGTASILGTVIVKKIVETKTSFFGFENCGQLVI